MTDHFRSSFEGPHPLAAGSDDPDQRPVALEPQPPPAGNATPPAHEPRRTTPLQWVVLAVLLLLTASVYFIRLSSPGDVLAADAEECRKYPPLDGQCYELIPLDEVHYVPDARDVVRFGTESDVRVPKDDGPFVVHPPVGKWFIAAGIAVFGDRPFGWRAFGAAFGVLGVLLAFLLGRALLGSRWAALMAAFLVATDGLWFVQSRVAMLDIYTAVLALAGVWMLVEDRQRWRGGPHWWRLGAGALFGLALATKWGALPILVAGTALASAWEATRPRKPTERHWLERTLALAATFTLLPAAVYVATFTPWFLDGHRYAPPLCEDEPNVASQWLCYQGEMLAFHRRLEKYEVKQSEGASAATAGTGATADATDGGSSPRAERSSEPTHPYFGEAWSWPWIGRPVSHFYDSDGEGAKERAREVLGLPNPLSWWPAFFVAIPLVAVRALVRRDRAAFTIMTFVAAGYLPYLVADVVDRPVFLFYATPLVPFLALALASVLVGAARAKPQRVLVGAYLALVLASFAYFHPVLAARPLTSEQWRARMWLQSDCSADERIKIACWI